MREAIEVAATLRASSRPVLGPDRPLELEAGGRRLLVHYGSGYRHAQVFAPPGGEFVCLEPMTAPTNALGAGACPLVEPGGAFTARFALRVEEDPAQPMATALPPPAATALVQTVAVLPVTRRRARLTRTTSRV